MESCEDWKRRGAPLARRRLFLVLNWCPWLMDEVPPILADIGGTCESLHVSVDALRELARVTVDVEVSSPGWVAPRSGCAEVFFHPLLKRGSQAQSEERARSKCGPDAQPLCCGTACSSGQRQRGDRGEEGQGSEICAALAGGSEERADAHAAAQGKRSKGVCGFFLTKKTLTRYRRRGPTWRTPTACATKRWRWAAR